MKKIIMATILIIAGVAMTAYALEPGGGSVVITKGSKVAFDYTLTVDGKVIDTSAGRAPLNFTQGDGRLLPALEKQLEGMKAGEEKDIFITPTEGYGTHDPARLQEVQKKTLPPDIKAEKGTMLQGKNPDGSVFTVMIAEVKKDTVVIDLNHPLAGKTLNFHIKIASVA